MMFDEFTTLSRFLQQGGNLEDLDVTKCICTITNLRPASNPITVIQRTGLTNGSREDLYEVIYQNGYKHSNFHPSHISVPHDAVLSTADRTPSDRRRELMQWYNKLSTNDLELIKSNWEGDV